MDSASGSLNDVCEYVLSPNARIYEKKAQRKFSKVKRTVSTRLKTDSSRKGKILVFTHRRAYKNDCRDKHTKLKRIAGNKKIIDNSNKISHEDMKYQQRKKSYRVKTSRLRRTVANKASIESTNNCLKKKLLSNRLCKNHILKCKGLKTFSDNKLIENVNDSSPILDSSNTSASGVCNAPLTLEGDQEGRLSLTPGKFLVRKSLATAKYVSDVSTLIKRSVRVNNLTESEEINRNDIEEVNSYSISQIEYETLQAEASQCISEDVDSLDECRLNGYSSISVLTPDLSQNSSRVSSIMDGYVRASILIPDLNENYHSQNCTKMDEYVQLSSVKPNSSEGSISGDSKIKDDVSKLVLKPDSGQGSQNQFSTIRDGYFSIPNLKSHLNQDSHSRDCTKMDEYVQLPSVKPTSSEGSGSGVSKIKDVVSKLVSKPDSGQGSQNQISTIRDGYFSISNLKSHLNQDSHSQDFTIIDENVCKSSVKPALSEGSHSGVSAKKDALGLKPDSSQYSHNGVFAIIKGYFSLSQLNQDFHRQDSTIIDENVCKFRIKHVSSETSRSGVSKIKDDVSKLDSKPDFGQGSQNQVSTIRDGYFSISNLKSHLNQDSQSRNFTIIDGNVCKSSVKPASSESSHSGVSKKNDAICKLGLKLNPSQDSYNGISTISKGYFSLSHLKSHLNQDSHSQESTLMDGNICKSKVKPLTSESSCSKVSKIKDDISKLGSKSDSSQGATIRDGYFSISNLKSHLNQDSQIRDSTIINGNVCKSSVKPASSEDSLSRVSNKTSFKGLLGLVRFNDSNEYILNGFGSESNKKPGKCRNSKNSQISKTIPSKRLQRGEGFSSASEINHVDEEISTRKSSSDFNSSSNELIPLTELIESLNRERIGSSINNSFNQSLDSRLCVNEIPNDVTGRSALKTANESFYSRPRAMKKVRFSSAPVTVHVYEKTVDEKCLRDISTVYKKIAVVNDEEEYSKNVIEVKSKNGAENFRTVLNREVERLKRNELKEFSKMTFKTSFLQKPRLSNHAAQLQLADVSFPIIEQFRQVHIRDRDYIHCFAIVISSIEGIDIFEYVIGRESPFRESWLFNQMTYDFEIQVRLYYMRLDIVDNPREMRKNAPRASFTLCAETKLNINHINKTKSCMTIHNYFFDHYDKYFYFKFICPLVSIFTRKKGFLEFGVKNQDKINWNKKWCVLYGSTFCIYNHRDDDYEQYPVDILNLEFCIGNVANIAGSNKKRSFQLSICKSKDKIYKKNIVELPRCYVKKYYFSAKFFLQYKRWTKKIKRNLKTLSYYGKRICKEDNDKK